MDCHPCCSRDDNLEGGLDFFFMLPNTCDILLVPYISKFGGVNMLTKHHRLAYGAAILDAQGKRNPPLTYNCLNNRKKLQCTLFCFQYKYYSHLKKIKWLQCLYFLVVNSFFY